MESRIVNLDTIVPPTHQPRSEVGDVSDLATAIASTYTFNSAMSVKRRADGKLQIFCGERRYWAMRKAVADNHDLPPLVPVIIYQPEELTPDLEWMLALDENRVRRPLSPVDEARAVVELKLRVDCMELRRKLEGTEGWDDGELPQSLEAWQAEYARLTQLAETQGRSLTSLLIMPWKTLEAQLRISERERRRMEQLASAPAATQAALQKCRLGISHQVAFTYAPAHRQIDLIRATETISPANEVPRAALYAAAYALADTRTENIPAAEVLTEALRLYRLEPKQSPKELCAATINNLTRATEEFSAEAGTASEEQAEVSEGEAGGGAAIEQRELSPAEASAFIDQELEVLQGANASANGQAAGTRSPTHDRPRRAPASEEDKLDSMLDTLERAVDYFLAAHRRQGREQMIARLREMLRRLEAAE